MEKLTRLDQSEEAEATSSKTKLSAFIGENALIDCIHFEVGAKPVAESSANRMLWQDFAKQPSHSIEGYLSVNVVHFEPMREAITIGTRNFPLDARGLRGWTKLSKKAVAQNFGIVFVHRELGTKLLNISQTSTLITMCQCQFTSTWTWMSAGHLYTHWTLHWPQVTRIPTELKPRWT